MVTVTVTTDVDIPLHDVDTEDLLEELNSRQPGFEHLDLGLIGREIYTAHCEKNQSEYERLVAMLVYGISGRIM